MAAVASSAAAVGLVSDKHDSHIDDKPETSVESPAESPIESPTESPVEPSVESPSDSPVSSPTQSPLQSPRESSVDIPRSPSQDETTAETPKMAHDSMVTVRLSEPPSLTLDTSATSSPDRHSSPVVSPRTVEDEPRRESNDSTPVEAPETTDADHIRKSVRESVVMRESRTTLPRVDTTRSLQDELGECDDSGNGSDTSEDNEEVNWEELEKTEDQQTKDEETDNASPTTPVATSLPMLTLFIVYRSAPRPT